MHISRDSFARTELHKLKWRTERTCKWCGQNKRDKRRGVPVGAPYLFVFRVLHDGGRVEHITGEFCSVSCMRSYHS